MRSGRVSGKRPKPTHLHLVEGTLNVTRHAARKGEPKPAKGKLIPPAYLSLEEKATFALLLNDVPPGMLTKLDVVVFTAWVTVYEQWKLALANLRLSGHLGRTTNGNIVPATPLGIFNTLTRQLAGLAAELGFSPVSRARVATEPVKDGDEGEDFLQRLGV